MKKILLFFVATVFCSLSIFAQADKIIGNYYAKLSNNDAKVKVFKYQDGYRMQIYWLKQTHNADGSLKVDSKNPDKSKRKIPTSQCVLIDKVTYSDGIWQDGKIYDPTSGKTYKVELRLNGNTLQVTGKVAFFSKSFYWKRI